MIFPSVCRFPLLFLSYLAILGLMKERFGLKFKVASKNVPNDIMLPLSLFVSSMQQKKSGYWKSVCGLEPCIFDAIFLIYKEERNYLPLSIEESNSKQLSCSQLKIFHLILYNAQTCYFHSLSISMDQVTCGHSFPSQYIWILSIIFRGTIPQTQARH